MHRCRGKSAPPRNRRRTGADHDPRGNSRNKHHQHRRRAPAANAGRYATPAPLPLRRKNWLGTGSPTRRSRLRRDRPPVQHRGASWVGTGREPRAAADGSPRDRFRRGGPARRVEGIAHQWPRPKNPVHAPARWMVNTARSQPSMTPSRYPTLRSRASGWPTPQEPRPMRRAGGRVAISRTAASRAARCCFAATCPTGSSSRSRPWRPTVASYVPGSFQRAAREREPGRPAGSSDPTPGASPAHTRRLCRASQSGQGNSKPKPRFAQQAGAAETVRARRPRSAPAGLPPERRISRPDDHRPNSLPAAARGAAPGHRTLPGLS